MHELALALYFVISTIDILGCGAIKASYLDAKALYSPFNLLTFACSEAYSLFTLLMFACKEVYPFDISLYSPCNGITSTKNMIDTPINTPRAKAAGSTNLF